MCSTEFCVFFLQMQHMEEHKDLLRSLVGKVADSADPSNLFTIQLAQLLRDYSDELENLTATAITMADVMMKSGKLLTLMLLVSSPYSWHSSYATTATSWKT